MSAVIYVSCISLYFFVAKRMNCRFTGVTFLFVCVSIYFMPLLLGTVVRWESVFTSGDFAVPTRNELLPISHYLTALYIFISLLCFVADIFLNSLMPPPRASVNLTVPRAQLYIALVMFGLLYAGLLLSGKLFKADAAQGGAGVQLSLLIAMSIIVIGYAAFCSSSRIKVISFIVALSTLATGSRTPFAVYFFLIFVNLFIVGQMPIRRIVKQGLRLGVLALGGICAIYFSKYLYSYIYIHGPAGLGLLYTSISDSSFCFVCGFEPAVQLSIVDLVRRNTTLLSDIDLWNVLLGWLSFLPIPMSIFGTSSDYVSEFVRGSLFPNAGYSIAGNVLAEAYLIGGPLGPFMFSCFWVAAVFVISIVISNAIKKNRGHTAVFFAVVLVYVCFFWNRYMIASSLGHIRNYAYPFLVVWMCARVVQLARVK